MKNPQYFLVISSTDIHHFFDVVNKDTLQIVKKHHSSYCWESEDLQREIKIHLSEFEFLKIIYVG